MTAKIKAHMVSAYPNLRELFVSVPEVKRLRPSSAPLPDAVVRIIVGQMLSRGAADAIRKRVNTLAAQRGCYAWQLKPRSLATCGLSRTKARAIYEFGKRYTSDPAKYARWKTLDTPSLFEAISSEWGMGPWTASILGISHFGREDIFPHTDGTLSRALEWLQRFNDTSVSPDLASPYRSYLALYLWAAVDGGHLRRADI